MRDIILQELRTVNEAIKGLPENIREKGNHILCRSIETMVELSYTARKGGLLALEEAASEPGDLNNKQYLDSMIMLVVNGAFPEDVEELSVTKYFSLGLKKYDALQYLIMLFGILAIQAGENSRYIEKKLLSLLPEEAVNVYGQKKRK